MHEDVGEDTGPTTDTGWFADTAYPEACPAYVVDVHPKTAVSDWYWRDAPRFWVNHARPEAYSARIFDGLTEVESSLQWSEGSGL